MDEKAKTIVVIPTYNEAGCIERLVSQILCFQPESDILIVDDNSPDGTARIVEELAKRTDKIKILKQPRKTGLGKAYIEGFKYVLSRDPFYEKIIEMDADFSHHPKYLSDLINATQDNDISIGSRYIRGGRVLGWRLDRRILSYIANLYVRFWLGLKVRDCTSGFRCFRREVLSNIGLETIRAKGYLFQIEVLYRCLCLGYSLKEIPITFIERKEGNTKFGLPEVWEAIWGVLRIKVSI